jgi:hypothetical protein
MSTFNAIPSFETRRPAVAGMFYPGEMKKLQTDLGKMFAGVQSEKVTGKISAIVAPHAGYVYSGYVAAEAYGQLSADSYDTVAVISPSHRDYFRGVSVYLGDYQTPIGQIPVNREICEKLLQNSPLIKASELGHREEHALEVQLPFLQTKLQNFKLIPIVMGTQDWETCHALGEALGKALKDTCSLVVASSDLSHFYSHDVARRLDAIVVRDVELFDEKQLFDDIQKKKCEACGAGPIIASIIAAKHMGATSAKVLSYHTSGEVSGDYDEVVGYLSGVFYN